MSKWPNVDKYVTVSKWLNVEMTECRTPTYPYDDNNWHIGAVCHVRGPICCLVEDVYGYSKNELYAVTTQSTRTMSFRSYRHRCIDNQAQATRENIQKLYGKAWIYTNRSQFTCLFGKGACSFSNFSDVYLHQWSCSCAYSCRYCEEFIISSTIRSRLHACLMFLSRPPPLL